MMERRTWNNGFTVLELCIVLFVVSLLSLLILPLWPQDFLQDKVWPEYYLMKQSEALRSAVHVALDDGIVFNERGNVNQARTLIKNHKKIIVELGGGTLVFP